MVATVALTLFGLGYASASGAQVLEQRLAVSETRAAAREVEDKRRALEHSLARAEDLTRDAASVLDDAQVQTAAQSLTTATEAATDVASLLDIELGIAPVTVAAVTVTTGVDSPLTKAAAHVGATEATTNSSDAELVDVVKDDAIMDVLAGEVKNTDAVREATKRLEQVSDALDAAADDVQSRASLVEDATDEANLTVTVDEMDDHIADSAASIDSATAIMTAIASQVTNGATLNDLAAAVTELQDAANATSEIDRTDLASLTAGLSGIARATTELTNTVEAATSSHRTWISAENERRVALNDEQATEYEETLAQAREAYVAANLEFASSRARGWTGEPAEISGSNGRLISGSLCAVSFTPGHYLQCDAAATLENADEDYFAQTGLHLSMTDSYRSYALQVTTRARKPSTAAVPGTSNHGWGMAVDFNPAPAAWLRSNGKKYGWVHPTWAQPGGSKPESWHLEYVAPEVGPFVAPVAPDALEPAESALPNVPAGATNLSR